MDNLLEKITAHNVDPETPWSWHLEQGVMALYNFKDPKGKAVVLPLSLADATRLVKEILEAARHDK